MAGYSKVLDRHRYCYEQEASQNRSQPESNPRGAVLRAVEGDCQADSCGGEKRDKSGTGYDA
jgi:hypothetical protein